MGSGRGPVDRRASRSNWAFVFLAWLGMPQAWLGTSPSGRRVGVPSLELWRGGLMVGLAALG